MFETLLKLIAQTFEAHQVPYMLIGGQAVLLYGEARLTADVDVTLGFGPAEFDVVYQATREAGLQILVAAPQEFVRQNLVLPCVDPASKIRVDFIFSLSAFERQAVQRARTVSIEGASVRYATPEDLIVLKVMAGRPRDLEDVRSILLKQERLDVPYVRHWLRELQAGQEQDLAGSFEHLLKTAGPRTQPQ